MIQAYLLSYPHSGNSWVRYIVEYLSGIYTEGLTENGNPMEYGIGKVAPIDVEFSKKPILIKRHELKLDKIDTKPVIFLLRDYKQAIMRHYKDDSIAKIKKRFNDTLNGNQDPLYFELIRYYESWQKNKMLIYYEDLIREPVIEINRLIDFLKIKTDKYAELINHLDYHIEQSRQVYNNYASGVIDQYKKQKYKLNEKLKAYSMEWDIDVKDNFELADKYLKRYYE